MKRPKKLTRAQALAIIRIHAQNGDGELAIRVYVENRISYAAFKEAMTAHLK